MVNKKAKKHSGRYTPKIHSKMKYKEMKEEALEPQEEYDDWIEKRDGLRDMECLERKKRDKGKFPYRRGGRGRCK